MFWYISEWCALNVKKNNNVYWNNYLLYKTMTVAPSGLWNPTDLMTDVWVNLIRIEPLDMNFEKCPIA